MVAFICTLNYVALSIALSVTPTVASMTSTVGPSPSVSPVPDIDHVIAILSIETVSKIIIYCAMQFT